MGYSHLQGTGRSHQARLAHTLADMTRYVTLLRGVNVNGITIKMADLAEMLRGLGLANVTTVLASGNALFDAEDSAEALKATIEAALRERFGYDAWVQVLTLADVEAIVAAYPFATDEATHQPYVTFCADEASHAELSALALQVSSGVEQIAPGERVLYWEVPRGSSLDTPFAKATAKVKYKAVLTTRNMRTLKKFR